MTSWTETQRLREIIDQLTDEGWQVRRELRSREIPPPFRDMPADFVAFRGSEVLVGEVLSRKTASSRRLEELAKIVKEIPHAVFEVYWIGDEDADEPSVRDIRRIIRESRAIAEQSPQASLLMAMVAFEAALATYAESVEAVVSGTPRRLVEHLFSLGLIDPADHSRLMRLYKVRNAVAHAVSAEVPSLEDIAALRSIAERMVTGDYVSVDVMTDWLRDWLLDAGEAIPSRPGETLPADRANELSRLLRNEFPRTSPEARSEAVGNLGYANTVTGF